MYESDSEVGYGLILPPETAESWSRYEEIRVELQRPAPKVVHHSLSLTIDPIRAGPVEVHQRRPVYPTSPRSPPFFV